MSIFQKGGAKTKQIYVELWFLQQFIWHMQILWLARWYSGYRLELLKIGCLSVILSLGSYLFLWKQMSRWLLLGIEITVVTLVARRGAYLAAWLFVTLVEGGLLAFYPKSGFLLPVITAAILLYEKYGRKKEIYTICCKKDGKSIWIKALCDTGNSLYIPKSHSPVSVVTYEAVESLFVWDGFEQATTIPYQSIGKEQGYLLAVQIDEMYIREWNEHIKQPYLGIVYTKLAKDEQYQMILHKEFVKL